MAGNENISFDDIPVELAGGFDRLWANLGGQVMPKTTLDRIIGNIKSSKFSNWDSVHQAYDEEWKNYPVKKEACHGQLLSGLYLFLPT